MSHEPIQELSVFCRAPQSVKEEIKTYSINEIGKTPLVDVESDGGELSQQMHIDGKLPDEMGLDVAETSSEKIAIGENNYKAVKTVYVSNPDDPKLELLSKPFPEIMKQGGLQGDKSSTVRITLWEVDGLNIPYHELDLPGSDLAIGAKTVKVKYEMMRKPGNGKGVSIESRVETVTDLAAPRLIGDAKVPCIEVTVSGAMEHLKSGVSNKMSLNGKKWFNNEIPGRKAGSEIEFKDGDSSQIIKETILGYHFEPEQTNLSLESVPPLDERPEIPGERWEGMHLGAWRITYVMNVNQSKGIYAFGSMDRVVAIKPNGAYITESRGIDGMGNYKEPSYKMAHPDKEQNTYEYTDKPFKTGTETLRLPVGELETNWEIRKTSEKSDFAMKPSLLLHQVWRPGDSEKNNQVLPYAGAVQVFDYDFMSDSYRTFKTAVFSRLIDDNYIIRFNNKEVKTSVMLAYETEGDEQEYKYEKWKISAYSPKNPSGPLLSAESSIQNGLMVFTFVLSNGEFEDPCPTTAEAINNQVKASIPKVKELLMKMGQLISDDSFREAFIKDKANYEKGLLEIE